MTRRPLTRKGAEEMRDVAEGVVRDRDTSTPIERTLAGMVVILADAFSAERTRSRSLAAHLARCRRAR